jgi:hypothetical protein
MIRRIWDEPSCALCTCVCRRSFSLFARIGKRQNRIIIIIIIRSVCPRHALRARAPPWRTFKFTATTWTCSTAIIVIVDATTGELGTWGCYAVPTGSPTRLTVTWKMITSLKTEHDRMNVKIIDETCAA